MTNFHEKSLCSRAWSGRVSSLKAGTRVWLSRLAVLKERNEIMGAAWKVRQWLRFPLRLERLLRSRGYISNSSLLSESLSRNFSRTSLLVLVGSLLSGMMLAGYSSRSSLLKRIPTTRQAKAYYDATQGVVEDHSVKGVRFPRCPVSLMRRVRIRSAGRPCTWNVLV